jgi:formylglycine-generating enzyme required for sulfatase activity
MPAPNVQLEDLLALAETLRGAGFAIGTQQYIAAHELLIALAARARLPEDPRDWRSLLAPIFCSSRREQEEFAGYFNDWLRRRPALQINGQATPSKPSDAIQREPVRSSAFRRLRAALGINRLRTELRTRARALRQWLKRPRRLTAMAIALLLIAGAVYLCAKTERTLTGKVVEKDSGRPVFLANVSFADGKAETNGEGDFRLIYRARNFDRLWRRRARSAQVLQSSYEPATSKPVLLHRPEPQTIELKLLPQYRVPIAQVPLPTVTPSANPAPGPFDETVIPIQRRFWPAVIPLALFALWFLWSRLRRKLIAQRLQTSGTPRLQQLRLSREGVKLFDSPAFRRAIVELRRHRHVVANDLDLGATIRATIRQGGLFTPSFGRRRALPEYLLLIDRASLQDEQARVGDELAHRFAAGEIGVERYYFQGDARVCQQESLAPALTLNELAARYPEHRLLIFGDGAGFFDPFSGEPQRWLEQFAQWPERAIITPNEPGTAAEPQWSYREAVLQEQGFALLSPNTNGFEALTAWLNTGLTPGPRGAAAHPYPPMLAERPRRWMERRAANEKEAETLIEQLRRYLGESGWLWLRACAVYPQLTWELTLYLGARLLGQALMGREAWAGDMLRLVRLPWFRYGTMPDWLRAVLISKFSPPEETRVRGAIEDLLRHVLTKPGEAISLELATQLPTDHRRWRQWLAGIKRWIQRRVLYRKLKDQPPESQLHDFVFLSFLAGRRLQPLTVQAPKLWERVLFDRGRWTLGPQPVTVGVLAALSATVLWWTFWLSPILNTPDPRIGGGPTIAIPTVPSDVPITPTPAPSPTPAPWPVNTIAGGYRVEMGQGVTLDLVSVPGGEFMMGSPDSEEGRTADEGPQHRVRVAGFNMGKFEITQAQWMAVMGGKNPSNFKGQNLPVESVSWNDAVEFCRRLTARTGVPFRLPSEAEWEYAARARTTTPFAYGSSLSSEQANFNGEYPYGGAPKGIYRGKTTAVGSFAANKFGLFDMHGNVWEWCRDAWHNNYQGAPADGSAWLSGGDSSLRVLRGGSLSSNGDLCRSAFRSFSRPDNRYSLIGFRVVVAARTP